MTWEGSSEPRAPRLRPDIVRMPPSLPHGLYEHVVTDALDRSEPALRDDIRSVLTDYLDRITTIRKA